MLIILRTFLSGLIILSITLSSPYAQAADNLPSTEVFPPGEEPPIDPEKIGNDSMNTARQYELPVATFEYYGKKITVYSTDYAGLYVENDGRRWIFIPKDKSEADLVDKARRNDFSDWFKRGEFKLYDESNLNEVNRAKQLDKSSVEGIFVDQRGKEWIWIPDNVEPGEKPRMYLVRVDNMTTEQMLASFGHRMSADNVWVQSLKVYPQEQLKFSSALLLVQMARCFGGGVLDLSFKGANAHTPTCVDDFIAHLMDPKGWISFYFFIVANRIATNNLMKIAAITMASAKAGKSIPFVRSKILPLIPFLGMAAGSLASSFVTNILSAPSWGQCIELLSSEGLGSLPCREAYANMANMEFMGDFLGQTGAMISAAAMSHLTQILIKNAGSLSKHTYERMLAGGARYFVSGSAKAFAETARVGITAIKSIRLIKGGMAIVGGVAGFLFWVTTEVGSYVLFLMWDEIIRAPFMKVYNGITKSIQIKEGIDLINNAIAETDKRQWQTPYLIEECKMPYRMKFYGAPMAEAVASLWENLTVKPTCEFNSPFDIGIGKLKTSAKKYRETVLLTTMEESSKKWKDKVGGYLNSYRISKMITEYIYQTKERKLQTDLDVWLTAVFYTREWTEAFEQELPEMNEFKQTLYKQFMEMDPLIEKIGFEQRLNSSTDLLDRAFSYGFAAKETIASFVRSIFFTKADQETDRQKLKRLLVESKAYVVAHFEKMAYVDRLGMAYPADLTPKIRKAFDDFVKIDFTLLKTEERAAYIKEDNNDLINYMVSTFGPEPVNEVMYRMFCNRWDDNKDFNFGAFDMSIKNSGVAGEFKPPFILDLSKDDQEEFFNANCTDQYYVAMNSFTEKDFSKTWKFKNRAYPDPISLAIDVDVPLVGGESAQDSVVWWNTKAFRPTMRFTRNAIINYQQIITDNLLPQIPDLTEFQMRADAVKYQKDLFGNDYVTYRIGDDAPFFHSNLSRSILAQTQFVLDKIKYIAGNDPKISALALEVTNSMSRLLLSFRKIAPMSEVINKVDQLEGDLVRLRVDDAMGVEIRLKQFDAAAINLVLPEDSNTAIIDAMKAVHDSTSNLYHELTGVWFDDMTTELVTYKAGLKSDELRNISKEEYKKYIYFKLLHENVNDVVIEYLTLDLYKKLSLQPLLEITKPE